MSARREIVNARVLTRTSNAGVSSGVGDAITGSIAGVFILGVVLFAMMTGGAR